MTIKRFGTAQTVTIYESVEEILTSGTTWTPPSGVTLIDTVICIGGGRGGTGGCAFGATSGSPALGGDGGAGGAIATFFRLPVSGAVTYQIGSGGSGGSGATAATGTTANYPPSNWGNGGSTWFKSDGYVAKGATQSTNVPNLNSASAGYGARFSGVSQQNAPVGSGGKGGQGWTNGAAGQINAGQLFYPNLDSSNLISENTRITMTYFETGGGGGGSGTGGTAVVRYGRPGGGGSNTAGGTATTGDQTTNTGLNGGNATGYGCGGGGGAAVKANSVAGGTGGAGSSGAIILRYTKPVVVQLRDGAIV